MNNGTAVHISIYTGITSVSLIFNFFGIESFVLVALGIVSTILLLNLVLRGLGRFLGRNFAIKAWMKKSCSTLLAVLNVVALFCGFVYVAQDGMMFHNVHCQQSREFLYDRPGFREIMFTSENGRTYHGVMYQATDEQAPLVIYFGGNGEVPYRHAYS